MPLFKQRDKQCYFVHIPRTAGRYVFEMFMGSSNVRSKYFSWIYTDEHVDWEKTDPSIEKYCNRKKDDRPEDIKFYHPSDLLDTDNSIWTYRGIELCHLHYPLYVYYFNEDPIEDIPIIAVVREPYSRLASAINIMYQKNPVDYNSLMLNDFKWFMDHQIEVLSYRNNWYLPQYKFLSPQTYVWKYEDGFGDEFKEWVFDKTGIMIDVDERKVSYQKFEEEDYSKTKYQLDDRIEEHVREFYKKDYKIFNYPQGKFNFFFQKSRKKTPAIF